MIASASALVRAGGVLGAVSSQPPLTLRRVRDDDPDVCALCLVGSAAGPLGGDDYSLRLEVEDGARASLRAAGASLAQGRGARPSTVRLSASVGAGASLDGDPGALIVCQGAKVHVTVALELAESARVEWNETVVLGRTTDTEPGAAVLSWDVRRSGRPVLRQRVDLADDSTRGWWGMTAGLRVLTTVLLSRPGLDARTVVTSPTSVAQRVDASTVLITVLAADGAQAAQRARELIDAVSPLPVVPA